MRNRDEIREIIAAAEVSLMFFKQRLRMKKFDVKSLKYAISRLKFMTDNPEYFKNLVEAPKPLNA